MAVSKREDCTDILNVILEKMTLAEIAVQIGVCESTVYGWHRGRPVPMLAANKLKDILRSVKK